MLSRLFACCLAPAAAAGTILLLAAPSAPAPSAAVLAQLAPTTVITPTATPTVAAVPTLPPTPPPVSSGAVRLFLRGGDARALATCLNIARHTGRTTQVNRCRNRARAEGGHVVLLGTQITAVQTDRTTLGSPAQGQVALTAQGGNATAIATCVNDADQVWGRNKQVNRCTNIAVATGGTVVLVNVTITGVDLTHP